MKPWQQVGEAEILHDGWRKVFRKTYKMNSGREFTAEVVDKEGSSAAAVIALTADGKVVIARQFRPGPGMIMEELPGGAAEPDEDPEVAAMRELREETGYAPGRITKLGVAHKSAYRQTKYHYYLAEDCQLVDTTPNSDADEEIEVDLVSTRQLLANARAGRMSDIEAVFFAYEKLKELEGEK